MRPSALRSICFLSASLVSACGNPAAFEGSQRGKVKREKPAKTVFHSSAEEPVEAQPSAPSPDQDVRQIPGAADPKPHVPPRADQDPSQPVPAPSADVPVDDDHDQSPTIIPPDQAPVPPAAVCAHFADDPFGGAWRVYNDDGLRPDQRVRFFQEAATCSWSMRSKHAEGWTGIGFAEFVRDGHFRFRGEQTNPSGCVSTVTAEYTLVAENEIEYVTRYDSVACQGETTEMRFRMHRYSADPTVE